MGENYKPLYKSPQELEKAQNQCELQHLALFRNFLKNKKGMVEAMQKKDWKETAKLYNGKDYEVNNYHTKMEDSYKKFKGIK